MEHGAYTGDLEASLIHSPASPNLPLPLPRMGSKLPVPLPRLILDRGLGAGTKRAGLAVHAKS